MDKTKIKGLVVHCSATKANHDVNADEIDRWHRQKGWSGIGYHFVIKRDGTIENGRMIDETGAHARGFNKGTLGICMVGGRGDNGKPENNFTPEQERALEKLIKELYDFYPITFIVGHRDLPKVNKACPCFKVSDFLDEIGLFGDFKFTKEKYRG